MNANVKNTNEANTNKIDFFMLFMVAFPIFINVLAVALFFIGANKTLYPLWLIVLLLLDIYLLPILDLILLSSNGVSFTEPVKSSIFCFPLFVYYREKLTENSKLIFVLSIVSYVSSIYFFFMHLYENSVAVGSVFIYILVIFGVFTLLLKLFSAKDEKSDMVYVVYMMQTVLLLVLCLAIYVLKVVLFK